MGLLESRFELIGEKSLKRLTAIRTKDLKMVRVVSIIQETIEIIHRDLHKDLTTINHHQKMQLIKNRRFSKCYNLKEQNIVNLTK